jgi:hypothetical protein
MKLRTKRIWAVATAVITGFGAMIAGSTAQAASASNYASSYATSWHRTSFDASFQVRQLYSHSINAYNQANAVATRCNGCRSVAIAFQVVADARAADYVNGDNYATAVNTKCDNCQTLGVAYQFIVAKPTVLDWSDWSKLYRIDYQLQALRWSKAPTSTVAGQVDALAGQVADILAHAGSGHAVWPLVRHFLTWQH